MAPYVNRKLAHCTTWFLTPWTVNQTSVAVKKDTDISMCYKGAAITSEDTDLTIELHWTDL